MIRIHEKQLSISEYEKLIKSKFGLEKIQINVTDKCNSRCIFCFQDYAFKKSQMLSFSEIKNILVDCKILGAKNVSYMGGEIFTRNDMIDILKLTRELGYSCSIITNAQLLNDDIISQISELNISTVTVSLHTLNPTNYTDIYNVKMHPATVINNISNMLSKGINVGIAVTVINQNIIELPVILREMLDLGISKKDIVFNLLYPCKNYSELKVPIEKFKIILREHPEVMSRFSNAPGTIEKRSIICQAGKNLLLVDYNGDVKICGLLDEKIGNIRTDYIPDIWEKSNTLKSYACIRESDFPACSGCEENGKCSMCMARNKILNDSIYKLDKHFCTYVRLVNSLK